MMAAFFPPVLCTAALRGSKVRSAPMDRRRREPLACLPPPRSLCHAAHVCAGDATAAAGLLSGGGVFDEYAKARGTAYLPTFSIGAADCYYC